jgi:anti-sigma factor RsiW
MSDYLDGDMDARGRERLERHTRECSECRELLANLRTVLAALGRLRYGARAGVAEAVVSRVRRGVVEQRGAGHDGPA